MILSELKSFLTATEQFAIALPSGELVPRHFHVTEVGEVTKRFIDCGGTRRDERRISLQLWSADDYDHRLAPGKLLHILELAERELGFGDLELEVEYQGGSTIEKYALTARGATLQLTGRATACLAREDCGLPPVPETTASPTLVSIFDSAEEGSACTPGSGCC